MSIDTAFCQKLLSLTMEDIKPLTTVEERKAAWVIRVGNCWEFHGPQGYYWHGRADNAYDARSKGWAAWLVSKGAA